MEFFVLSLRLSLRLSWPAISLVKNFCPLPEKLLYSAFPWLDDQTQVRLSWVLKCLGTVKNQRNGLLIIFLILMLIIGFILWRADTRMQEVDRQMPEIGCASDRPMDAEIRRI